MQETVRAAGRLHGTITPPGNKSISHRAAVFNAIAKGEARVEGFLRSADCLATLACLRSLGVRWQWQDEEALLIQGAGKNGLREPAGVLNCRNSGTTARMLAGLLAPQPFFSILTGDSSLRSRPMARITEPLRQMGAQIWGRQNGDLLPLTIRGSSLRGIDYRMPVASAQVKTAIILAGLYAEGETTVTEPAPTRDHTERLLLAMGAGVRFGEGPVVRLRPLDGELRALSF